jgi:hypothetical protein
MNLESSEISQRAYGKIRQDDVGCAVHATKAMRLVSSAKDPMTIETIDV